MPPLPVLSRRPVHNLNIQDRSSTNTNISTDNASAAGRRDGAAWAAHVFDGLLPRRGRSTSRPERERTHSYYARHGRENEEGGGVAFRRPRERRREEGR